MLEVCGSKRKAKNFKDEENYISSVPTNHVRCTSFLSSNVSCPVILLILIACSNYVLYMLVCYNVSCELPEH